MIAREIQRWPKRGDVLAGLAGYSPAVVVRCFRDNREFNRWRSGREGKRARRQRLRMGDSWRSWYDLEHMNFDRGLNVMGHTIHKALNTPEQGE